MSYQKIDLTQAGGLYVYQDTLDYLQTAYNQQFDTISKFFGDKTIVSGVVNTGGTVSDGWVSLNGELLPVVGGAVMTYLYIETIVTDEQFDDAVQRPTYTVKRLKFTNTATGNYLFTDFKRLPYSGATIKEAFEKVQAIIKSIINVEASVIISGCDVSSVVGTTSGTCTISAGVCMFDGEYVAVSARVAGSFPCYLKADGTFVTVQPVSGNYITFDYETSQRYKHVLKRYITGSGETVMSTNASDVALFDMTTGFGKWKWLGWKINDLLRDRVPIGFERRSSDPNDGIYDANYRGVGNTGAQQNKRQLIASDIPELSGDVHYELNGTDGSTNNGENIYNGDGEGHGSGYENGAVRVNAGGGSTKVDIRQPYAVVLFIERI